MCHGAGSSSKGRSKPRLVCSVAAGLRCLDIGQSTGGFTDCLLQHGAAHVVGVDVGSGQVHPNIRADERVTCIEGVNARELDASHFIAEDDLSTPGRLAQTIRILTW
jgi:2-polyprenyl-3-methyl-5-hydroxy-6-metoxy-1,4-benzoquinol methylase